MNAPIIFSEKTDYLQNIPIIQSSLKHKILLFLIFFVVFGGILRFYTINSIPVSLYWDEVAAAYNAYSIAMTGRDEYGMQYPMLFRSFDDYKMPGYIYLTSLVIKLFGLTEFTARAISAFLGTGTIIATFFLIKELFTSYLQTKSRKNDIRGFIEKFDGKHIALLTTGLLAISPWHIQFSRVGFEANAGLFFVVLGAWLYLKGLNKYLYFLGSMVVFGISIYFYRSIHVFLPLLLLGFAFIYRKKVLQIGLTKNILSCFVFLLITIPLIPSIFSTGGLARAGQVNVITASQEQVFEAAKKRQERGDDLIGKILYNRRTIYIMNITKNYLSHFSPQFLFATGDSNGRHNIVGMGLLYWWELPFILIGLSILLKLKNKITSTVILWILLAPVPASLSIPAPHALRSLNLLPMPQLLTAVGIVTVLLLFQKRGRFIFVFLLTIISLFFFTSYLHQYYNVTAKVTAKDWGDGYKQLTEYVFAHEQQYEKVIVSGHYWQPYIYFLFYKQYDPIRFQQSGNNISFDKYYFGGTSWDREKGRDELGSLDLREIADSKSTLVALSPDEYAHKKNNIMVKYVIKNQNNETVFLVGDLR